MSKKVASVAQLEKTPFFGIFGKVEQSAVNRSVACSISLFNL